MKHVFSLLVAIAIPLFCAKAQGDNPPNALPHCGQLEREGLVVEGLYHGSKPSTEDDFQCLKDLNIRTLVSLEDSFMQGKVEGQLAQKYGMKLYSVPMQPSPVPPSENTVNKAMAYMRNTDLYPLYFHCHYGRDRTMLMMGLYENQFLNVSPQQSWNDMLSYGFAVTPKLKGLQSYFWDHVK